MKHISINEMPKTKSNPDRWYIKHEQLHEQFVLSKVNNKCTEELGELFMLVTNHIIYDYRFVNYPVELKEDMQSYALLKLMKCWKHYNIEKLKSGNSVNYVTRIVFTSFLTVISKYYKELNIKRAIRENAIEKLKQISNISK